jgi:hypothetical protein
MISDILSYASENPEQTLGALTAVAGVAGYYLKTGSLPLGRLPLKKLQHGWHDISARFFTHKRPRTIPGVRVDYTDGELEEKLRDLYFESGDLYSYEYEGEQLNLRRPAGLYGKYPSELHIRSFELRGHGSFLVAHHEASRFEAWDAHMGGDITSWSRGREMLTDVLDNADISYEKVESEASAGLDIV